MVPMVQVPRLEVVEAPGRDRDGHGQGPRLSLPRPGPHCHNNLYKGITWCTCKPKAAVARRSTEEIQEVSSSSFKPWSKPFCPLCSIAKEAATTNTTLASVAREKTSGKTREENPGTAREAGKATYVRTISPSTAREEMTPDKAAESALMTKRQLTKAMLDSGFAQ